MTDLSPDAQTNYESGIAPLDYAENEIESVVNANFAAALRAATEPGPHPDYSTAAMARRILGALINAGWQMPVWPIPEPHEVP
jgi:hypothetical protein